MRRPKYWLLVVNIIADAGLAADRTVDGRHYLGLLRVFYLFPRRAYASERIAQLGRHVDHAQREYVRLYSRVCLQYLSHAARLWLPMPPTAATMHADMPSHDIKRARLIEQQSSSGRRSDAEKTRDRHGIRAQLSACFAINVRQQKRIQRTARRRYRGRSHLQAEVS